MIKTLKGKVVTGTLALTLVAGAGVAFGASDAGANLQTWYKTKFTQNQVAVVGETGVYSGLKLAGLSLENINHKRDSTKEINSTRDTAFSSSETNINKESDDYITAIGLQKDSILNGMEDEFDKLSRDATNLMDKVGEETSKRLIDDLDRHTGGLGSAAVGKVEGDLNSVKTNAVNNLQTAIATAKSDILNELAKEKGLTIAEIKKMIDQKIIDLRKLITDSKDEMITAQQKLITDKATEIENAATLEMEKLVADILKK